jgi:integrase
MAHPYYEKRGKYWRYVFEGARIEGKRQRFTEGGFRTKAEAEKAAMKAVSEYNDKGRHFVPSEISYADLLNEWIENYCEVELKKQTVVGYKKRIKNLISPELGKYKLLSLDGDKLQKFIIKLATQGYSRNTLSSIKGILSASLNYAVNQTYLKYNPIQTVRLPSPTSENFKLREAPHHYIPADKIEMIFKRFPEGHPSFLPLTIGYRCGLRLGETFALTWDCIDFEKKTLTVNKQIQWSEVKQHWYFSNPKYNSFRTIEIDDDLVAIFKREKERQERACYSYGNLQTKLYVDSDRNLVTEKTDDAEPIDMVMKRDDGTYIQPRTMQHATSVIHYELEYPDFSYHSLRHTHASMLAESGAPIKYTQTRLGHKNAEMTIKVYQHLTNKMSDDGAGILNNMFNKGDE